MIPSSPLLVMDDPYGRIGDVQIFRYPINSNKENYMILEICLIIIVWMYENII